MRARYTAYVVQDYTFIWRTYANAQRANLSPALLADSAKGTRWLGLQVVTSHSVPAHVKNAKEQPASKSPSQQQASQQHSQQAQVEFRAFSKQDGHYHCLHELSDFVREQGEWRYLSGTFMADNGEFKPKVNGPCPCQSGKKFKKCCGRRSGV